MMIKNISKGRSQVDSLRWKLTGQTSLVLTTGPVTTCLLLIWLFQHGTSFSVTAWLDRHFRRTCANFSRCSPPKRRAGRTWLPAVGRTVLYVRSAGTEVLAN